MKKSVLNDSLVNVIIATYFIVGGVISHMLVMA